MKTSSKILLDNGGSMDKVVTKATLEKSDPRLNTFTVARKPNKRTTEKTNDEEQE